MRPRLRASGARQLETWPDPVVLRVRMGIHTGTADERDGYYFGPAREPCGPIRRTPHGGEILALRHGGAPAPRPAADVIGSATWAAPLKDLDFAGEASCRWWCPGAGELSYRCERLDVRRADPPVQAPRSIGAEKAAA